MQREIKFRAWDKEGKCMGEVPSLYKLCFEDGAYFDYNKVDWAKANVVFMQFTGLHDKNGKEIYEGDVVRIANYEENWKRGEPDFDWRVFQVIHNRYVYAFENSVIYTPFSHYKGKTLGEYHIEVIGNIYENPDLLTKDTQP